MQCTALQSSGTFQQMFSSKPGLHKDYSQDKTEDEENKYQKTVKCGNKNSWGFFLGRVQRRSSDHKKPNE